MPILLADALLTMLVTGGVLFFAIAGLRTKIHVWRDDRAYAKYRRAEEKQARKRGPRYGGDLHPQPLKRLNHIKR